MMASKIEPEFLLPVIKSPKECKRIAINPRDLNFKIFVCSKDKQELKGTVALQYIEWGESKNFNKRASYGGSLKWWSLSFDASNSIFVKEANDTSAVFYNPDNYPVDCRLYYAHLSPITRAYLNSVVGAMLFEIYNRAGLGEGARSMMVSDYMQVPVLAGNADIESSLQKIYPLAPRKLTVTPSEEWKEIDTITFDILNLTQGERDGVYEAVIELVRKRLSKANSLNGARNRDVKDIKELRKRMDAVNQTLGIWMGVPEEIEEL